MLFPKTCYSSCKAYDIDAAEAENGPPTKSPLWPRIGTVLPGRWIWAPLPQNAEESKKIVVSAVTGGDDVISMPKYFKPWNEGLPSLKTQLKKVDDVPYFAKSEKKRLKERMKAAGLPDDQPITMPLTGRGHPLLAVFDPATLKIAATLKAN